MRKVLLIFLCLILSHSLVYGQGCDSNTQFLNHFDCTDGDSDALDENCDSSGAHTITWNATSQCDSGNTKFDNTLLLDGNSDYLSVPDSSDWDMFASNSDNWNVGFWVKHASDPSATTQLYIGQIEDTDNYWYVIHQSGVISYRFRENTSPSLGLEGNDGISDTNWHWISTAKVGNTHGLYLDGTQIAYGAANETDTFSAPLRVGAFIAEDIGLYVNGNMEEVRIQKDNDIGASPVVGLTDTLTVPTEAYSVASSRNRMINITKFIKNIDGNGYRRHRWQENAKGERISEIVID